MAGFLLLVVAIYGAAALLKGGLYVGNYEGDTAHLVDLVLRLAAGERPHQDFMTPLGILGYAPIALFVRLGAGVGHAIMLGQVLVALCLVPAIWWAGVSRLSGAWPYLFGFFALVLVLALSQGQVSSATSIAMYYNRWAWAAAYVAVLVAVIEPRHRRSALADGLLIGMLMAFLALSKLTYFISFAVPLLLALALRRQWAVMGIAAGAGAGVAAIVTLVAGVAFWGGYLGDLITVASSGVRPYPTAPFLETLRLPTHIGGTLLMFLSVILLRQAGQRYEGLILLVLAPAFFYVTFQNFGNDPQWMVLAGFLVLLMRPGEGVKNPFGWDLRQALNMAAVAFFAIGSPAAFNMIYSPVVHFGAADADYTPFLPNRPDHADLKGELERSYQFQVSSAPEYPAVAVQARALRPVAEKTVLNGEALNWCEIGNGPVGWYRSMAQELDAAGYGGEDRIMVADILNVLWMFGDLKPLKGSGPWYYGGAPGLENTDYVLVPFCPYKTSERRRILKAIEARGVPLTEVYRSELFILLRRGAIQG